MGLAWCHELDGTPVRCLQIQPPRDIDCSVQGNGIYIPDDDDVAPGELLIIWIRAIKNGVASPVCTHDGGPLDCGTPEVVGEGYQCAP